MNTKNIFYFSMIAIFIVSGLTFTSIVSKGMEYRKQIKSSEMRANEIDEKIKNQMYFLDISMMQKLLKERLKEDSLDIEYHKKKLELYQLTKKNPTEKSSLSLIKDLQEKNEALFKDFLDREAKINKELSDINNKLDESIRNYWEKVYD